MRNIVAELRALADREGLGLPDDAADEIKHLRAALRQCFTDAGGDTDGNANSDAISTEYLIRMATDCVKDLRECYDELLDESGEADRLRARVAELEAARREPVAWMRPEDGFTYEFTRVRPSASDRPQSWTALYTAPPAPTVDVDAISEETMERARRIMWGMRESIFDTKDK